MFNEINFDGSLKLNEPDLTLVTYCGTEFNVLGFCYVNVTMNTQQYNLKVYVVKNRKHSLLGRNWLRKLKIDVNEKIFKTQDVKCILSKENVLNEMKCKYPEVFFGKILIILN